MNIKNKNHNLMKKQKKLRMYTPWVFPRRQLVSRFSQSGWRTTSGVSHLQLLFVCFGCLGVLGVWVLVCFVCVAC